MWNAADETPVKYSFKGKCSRELPKKWNLKLSIFIVAPSAKHVHVHVKKSILQNVSVQCQSSNKSEGNWIVNESRPIAIGLCNKISDEGVTTTVKFNFKVQPHDDVLFLQSSKLTRVNPKWFKVIVSDQSTNVKIVSRFSKGVGNDGWIQLDKSIWSSR